MATTRPNRWVCHFDLASSEASSSGSGGERRKFLKTTPRGTHYYKWVDCSSDDIHKEAEEFFNKFNLTRKRNSAVLRWDAKRSQERLISEALGAHNRYRLRHGVEPLVHNPELSKIAQSFADLLASQTTANLYHSSNMYKNSPLGENLAWMYNPNVDHYSGEDVTKQWYSEESMHNYDSGYQSKTGHFTQIVWKSTREVGFGLGRNSNYEYYIVANYYPAGNYHGKFKSNVLRPTN